MCSLKFEARANATRMINITIIIMIIKLYHAAATVDSGSCGPAREGRGWPARLSQNDSVHAWLRVEVEITSRRMNNNMHTQSDTTEMLVVAMSLVFL